MKITLSLALAASAVLTTAGVARADHLLSGDMLHSPSAGFEELTELNTITWDHNAIQSTASFSPVPPASYPAPLGSTSLTDETHERLAQGLMVEGTVNDQLVLGFDVVLGAPDPASAPSLHTIDWELWYYTTTNGGLANWDGTYSASPDFAPLVTGNFTTVAQPSGRGIYTVDVSGANIHANTGDFFAITLRDGSVASGGSAYSWVWGPDSSSYGTSFFDAYGVASASLFSLFGAPSNVANNLIYYSATGQSDNFRAALYIEPARLPVPEPGTLALAVLGLGSLAARAARRGRRQP